MSAPKLGGENLSSLCSSCVCVCIIVGGVSFVCKGSKQRENSNPQPPPRSIAAHRSLAIFVTQSSGVSLADNVMVNVMAKRSGNEMVFFLCGRGIFEDTLRRTNLIDSHCHNKMH